MKARVHVRTGPLWLGGLAMLCVGAGLPRAFADTRADTEPGHSIKVKYGDLNLANDAGVAALYKRIQHAASIVCEADSTVSDPLRLYHRRRCELAVVAKAVSDVDNKNLTAMYREKRGLPPLG